MGGSRESLDAEEIESVDRSASGYEATSVMTTAGPSKSAPCAKTSSRRRALLSDQWEPKIVHTYHSHRRYIRWKADFGAVSTYHSYPDKLKIAIHK